MGSKILCRASALTFLAVLAEGSWCFLEVELMRWSSIFVLFLEQKKGKGERKRRAEGWGRRRLCFEPIVGLRKRCCSLRFELDRVLCGLFSIWNVC